MPNERRALARRWVLSESSAPRLLFGVLSSKAALLSALPVFAVFAVSPAFCVNVVLCSGEFCALALSGLAQPARNTEATQAKSRRGSFMMLL